jgi:hypothetical protein
MRKLIVFLVLVLLLPTYEKVTAFQSAETMNYGNAVSGEINDAQPNILYQFEGAEGDLIYINLLINPDELLPQLRLIGVNGATLSGVSEYGQSLMLGPLALPETGTYGIEVGRPFDSSEAGAFQLRLDLATVTPLATNATFSGTLAGAGTAHFFEYPAQAGQFIATAVTADAQIGLWVLTPGQEYVIQGGFNDSWFSPLDPLPETGNYLIYVQTNVNAEVQFTLDIAAVEPIPLNSGETFTGSIAEFPPAVFVFESLAGSGELLGFEGDNALEIFLADDLSGVVVADYGSGVDGNPLLDPFIAPVDGQYYVVLYASDYDPATNLSTDYALSLFPSTVISLAPGSAVTNTATTDGGRIRYSYRAAAGETIRLTLAKTNDEGSAGLQIISPTNSVILEILNDQILDNASFEVTLPVEGVYMIDVYNTYYEPSSVEFSLLLEPVAE